MRSVAYEVLTMLSFMSWYFGMLLTRHCLYVADFFWLLSQKVKVRERSIVGETTDYIHHQRDAY